MHPEHLSILGRAAFDAGDHAAAETHFKAALANGKTDFETLSFLGYLARRRDALDEAAGHYARALDRLPGDAPTANNLAEIRRAQGRMGEAIALYKRAAELAPDKPEIHANLGAALLSRQRPDLALAPLRRAVGLNPDLTMSHADLGTALSCLNRYPEALAHYRAIVDREPGNNNARYMEALALLAVGDFANGWRKHEVRWYADLGQGHRAKIEGRYWLGEDDIAGKRLLLHAEQGLGDTIHFVRYAPMAAERGARAILMVPKSLAPVMRDLPGVEIALYGDPIPEFDAHCSLMSLPRAFRTTVDTIPARVPYVSAPPDRVAAWAERLGPRGGRRRIAIAWSGSDTVWNRSIPLALLAGLLARPDCEFHVAQTEIRDSDRAALDGMPHVVEHGAALADFGDTAALLTHMDLTLTVDTVLAHLSGAMARPTWTMLPLGADYRWLTDRDSSPWYPGMRLFRQPALSDWDGVVAAVGRALDAMPA